MRLVAQSRNDRAVGSRTMRLKGKEPKPGQLAEGILGEAGFEETGNNR
jgi:hypothetical protein